MPDIRVTYRCASCGNTLETNVAALPPGWWEDAAGAEHCPRHRPVVIAEEVRASEVVEEALAENRRRSA